jgi:transposase
MADPGRPLSGMAFEMLLRRIKSPYTKGPCSLTYKGGFPNRGGLIQIGAEDSRHAFSGEIARELFGRGASGVGPALEGRQLQLGASVAGCGRGWNESGRCGEHPRHGPSEPCDWTEGHKPRLSTEQLAQFAQIVEAGPDREEDGVVRWRRIDLKRVIAERFGVNFRPRYVGTLLKKLGFFHISARPHHPAQDQRIVVAFKKTPRAR